MGQSFGFHPRADGTAWGIGASGEGGREPYHLHLASRKLRCLPDPGERSKSKADSFGRAP